MKIKKVAPAELKKMLAEGSVKFQFTKKNGEVRTAIGTNKPELMTKKPSGGYNPAKEAGYTPYFDIEKNAFRCFNEDKLIGVVED